MGLFDRFKKQPKWEHENSNIRLNAVKELNDQDILVKIAKNDSDWKVREEAIKKINNENTVSVIIKNEPDGFVRETAVRCKINNQNVLKDIVKNDPNEDVRSSAIEKIQDEKVLLDVINTDDSVIVRKDAVYRLTYVATSMSVFEELSKHGKPDDIKILAKDLSNNPKVRNNIEKDNSKNSKNPNNVTISAEDAGTELQVMWAQLRGIDVIEKAKTMENSVDSWSDESKAFYYYIIGHALKFDLNVEDETPYSYFAAQLFYNPANTSLGWVEIKKLEEYKDLSPSKENAEMLHNKFPLPNSLDELNLN